MNCKRCGECCRVLDLHITAPAEDSENDEFYKIRGFDISDGFEIRIPHVCQHLVDNDCIIYENRPRVCREFKCEDIRQDED